MEYIATFHTHYGALLFEKHRKAEGASAKLMPVPRKLSTSCGVCVRFEAERPVAPENHEDMEACYQLGENGNYIKI